MVGPVTFLKRDFAAYLSRYGGLVVAKSLNLGYVAKSIRENRVMGGKIGNGVIGGNLPGLRTPSIGYKPFRYPWAYEFWRKQQQVHWMPEEVPARRGRQGLGLQAQRPGAQSADADFPLLHPGRCRGERQLHGALCARVQTGRSQDDARVVFQHRDHPHRRLRAAARNHRHAGERVRRVPGLPGDARQARLHAANSASRATRTSCARWRCSAPSPKACSCSPRSRC